MRKNVLMTVLAVSLTIFVTVPAMGEEVTFTFTPAETIYSSDTNIPIDFDDIAVTWSGSGTPDLNWPDFGWADSAWKKLEHVEISPIHLTTGENFSNNRFTVTIEINGTAAASWEISKTGLNAPATFSNLAKDVSENILFQKGNSVTYRIGYKSGEAVFHLGTENPNFVKLTVSDAIVYTLADAISALKILSGIETAVYPDPTGDSITGLADVIFILRFVANLG